MNRFIALSLTLWSLSLQAPVASAQPADPPVSGRQIRPTTLQDLPWQARPGALIQTVRHMSRTVDRVVLVPDAATFEFAMRQWSLFERWPILIEDDYYTPMFIRRFQPDQVYRMQPVAAQLPVGDKLQQRLIDTAALAWQPIDPDTKPHDRSPQPVKQSWEALGWSPPGVVITSTKDDAWPAALALAADRGQPITFYEDRLGVPDGSVSAQDWPGVLRAVEQRVQSTGYEYKTLGDTIDTITIVRDLPVKYATNDPRDPDGRLALTDGITRTIDGDPWAVTGWIFGPAPRATYMAMCAIFLSPESALLYDTYPDEPGWSRYEMKSSADDLTKLGFDIQHVAQPTATNRHFQRLAPDGLSRDLIFVNTKGHQNYFDIGKRRVYVHDLPILNTPAAVHFIHSWSTIAPAKTATLAGRWLDRGAYLYVGSVHEPGLGAFMPPKAIIDRLMGSVPFHIATKVYGMQPWRVTTIGDPLATFMRPIPRIENASAQCVIEATNLRDHLASLTQQARENDSPHTWAQVARTCILLGHDDLAAKIYSESLDGRASADDLLPLLPALFIHLDADEFVNAAMQIPHSSHTPRSIDLVWLKAIPSLHTWRDKDQLRFMLRSVRSPVEFSDAAHLAPALYAAGLSGDANTLLDRAEADASDGYVRQLIRAARRQR